MRWEWCALGGLAALALIGLYFTMLPIFVMVVAAIAVGAALYWRLR